MKYIVFISGFFLCYLQVAGQSTTYTGVVYDTDHLTIPGVWVSVKDTSIKTETNFDGEFEIEVPDTSKVLTFNYVGFRELHYKLENEKHFEVILKPSFTHDYPGIWASIGTFSDVTYAPYGIEISNGQNQKDILYLHDFQEDFSARLAFATDFEQSLTYEAKLVYHRRLLRHAFYDTGLSYSKKDYDELEYEELSIDTKIVYLRFLNTHIVGKFGLQTFDAQSNAGSAFGFESEVAWKDYLYGILNFGGAVGFWNDYYTYELFLNTFIYSNKISLHLNYKNINKLDFFTIGVHFLFSTKKEFDLYYNQ